MQVPQEGTGALGQLVMAAGHDLECLELRNVPTRCVWGTQRGIKKGKQVCILEGRHLSAWS